MVRSHAQCRFRAVVLGGFLLLLAALPLTGRSDPADVAPPGAGGLSRPDPTPEAMAAARPVVIRQYREVLGRDPDAAGAGYLVWAVAAGEMAEPDVRAFLLGSREAVEARELQHRMTRQLDRLAGGATLIISLVWSLWVWRCRPAPAVRRTVAGLLLFWLAGSLWLNAYLQRHTRVTVLETTREFLTWPAHEGADSWRPMQAALHHLRARASVPVYQALFFQQGVKFQYPLTSLLPLEPLAGWTPKPFARSLNVLAWMAAIGTLLISARLLVNGLRTLPGWPGRDDSVFAGIIMTAWVASGWTFYPLVRGLGLGQVQTAVNLLVAAGLWARQCRRTAVCGVLLALAALIKPQFVLLGLWGLIRWDRHFLAGFAGTILTVGGAALWRYGWAQNLDYLPVLAYIGKHGEAFVANQSINGLLNRAFLNGPFTIWDGAHFAPFHPWVWAGTLAGALALLVPGLLQARRSRDGAISDRGLDLGVWMLTLVMSTPVAWEHHYGVVFPLLALMIPVAVQRGDWRNWIGMAVGWLLLANVYPLPDRLADTAWRILFSGGFIGACVLLATAYRLRGGPTGTGTVKS